MCDSDSPKFQLFLCPECESRNRDALTRLYEFIDSISLMFEETIALLDEMLSDVQSQKKRLPERSS